MNADGIDQALAAVRARAAGPHESADDLPLACPCDEPDCPGPHDPPRYTSRDDYEANRAHDGDDRP